MTTRFSDPVTGQVDPTDTLDPGQVGDGIICGLSGWFTPYGVRYHEDIRPVSEIDPTDWSALLEHARSIDFSSGSNRYRQGPAIVSFTSG